MRRRRLFNLKAEGIPLHEITLDRKVTPKHTQKYHKKKRKIPKIIRSKTGKHEIIHGEHAVRKQVPVFMHRHTGDVDILTPTPREDAFETEKALDKEFKGDFFYTEPGIHVGTWRVKSRNTKESVADYTKMDKKIPHVLIDGKNYATLGHMKKKAKEAMDDPFSSFRHAKDQDTINRIKIVESKRRKR